MAISDDDTLAQRVAECEELAAALDEQVLEACVMLAVITGAAPLEQACRALGVDQRQWRRMLALAVERGARHVARH